MRHHVRGFAAALLLAVSVTVAASGITFASLVDRLDIRKSTKLQVDEVWKGVKGQEVTWSGEVIEARSGKRGAKVYLVDRSRRNFKGYNIVLATKDVETAVRLKRGQKVRFRGTLHDHDHHNNGSVSIDLRDGEILR